MGLIANTLELLGVFSGKDAHYIYPNGDEGLVLFKRLCRYYYAINPQVTVEYIGIYRDLYDSEEEGDHHG